MRRRALLHRLARAARARTLILATVILAAMITAQPPLVAAGPPAVHALTHVRIVVAPGQVIDSGTVVVRDGVIVAAGADVEPPADARVWDHEGHTVYAGLIDLYAPQSWPEEETQGGPAAQSSQGQAAQVHSSEMLRVVEPRGLHATRETAWLGLDDGSRKNLRSAGFTSALAVLDDGVFRGTSALLAVGDGDPARDLLVRNGAQHASLRAPNGGNDPEDYPSSTMGAVAVFRQALLDADWYRRAWEAYERNPAQARPPVDRNLEALAAVLDGTQQLIFETRDPLDSLRVIRLASEFGVRAALVGHGREYQILDDITAAGLPIVLPLAFPEPPTVGDDDDPAYSVDLTQLRHWDAAPDNPQLLLGAGLTVAFTSHGGRPAELFEHLAQAIERGLSSEQALAALTTTPATWLGVDDRLGTIEAGKLAHLVVVDGDLFVDKPNILETWVDGRRYEIKSNEAPKVDPRGSWEMQLTAGNGMEFQMELVIAGEPGAHTGSIGMQGGQSLPLSSATVSGSTLNLAYDATPIGLPGTITMSLSLSGDRMSGGGNSPMGPFTITGNRSAGSPSDPPSAARHSAQEDIL